MCGLTAAFSKKVKKGRHRAGAMAYELYKKQASRGRSGYGYVAIDKGQVVTVGRALDEDGIKSLIFDEEAEFVLLHHRLPTSTKNTFGTTHPILVQHEELEYDYYLAHNGVIINDEFLKKKHEELGYKYTTEFREVTKAVYVNSEEEEEELPSSEKTVFNDSESLAIEFARWVEGKSDKVNTTGAAAFWAVAMEKGTDTVHKVYFGKNYGRELGTSRNKRWFLLGSEHGQQIEEMKLYIFDVNNLKIEETDLDMGDGRRATGFDTYKTVPLIEPPKGKPLINALYNYRERLESGHDLNQFDCIQYGGAVFWRPTIYRSSPSYEKFAKVSAPTKIDEKTQERLEELCEELARIETKRDILEEHLVQRDMDISMYNFWAQEIESEYAMKEDLLATLGLEQDKIDETLELARQMEQAFPSISTYA